MELTWFELLSRRYHRRGRLPETNPGSLLEGRHPGSSRSDGFSWSNRRVATRGAVTGSRVGGIDQEVALFSDDPVLLNTRAMD